MKEKAKRLGTILFPVILFLYPLLKITQGIELTDTCYGLVNYRFSRMRGRSGRLQPILQMCSERF